MVKASLQSEPDLRECLHCGLPVPRNDTSFCCRGCEAIYATLHSLGLAEYYTWKRCVIDERERVAPNSFDKSDWSVFDRQEHEGSSVERDEISREYSFDVMGIHCAGCVWLLERLTQINPAIKRSVLNATTGRLGVRYEPNSIKLSQIAALLASLGYPPRLPGCTTERSTLDRTLLIRLGVAGFAALNTMMLAVSLFQGFFTGIDPAVANYFRWWSLVLALPAVSWAAWPLYRNAYAALRVRTLHIELPLSVAIVAAFALSVYNTLMDRPHVYYDSMCALIFFLLVGRTLQERALTRARRRARAGWSVLPSVTERMTDSSWEEIPLEQLAAGDTVRIKAGQRIPADGVVVHGTSSIDRSTLTGESLPQTVTVGAEVLAGTLNIDQEILMRVVSCGPRSRLALLLAEVERSAQQSAPLERFTHRVARWYVLGVTITAAVTFALWSASSLARASEAALTLLIVTCPCALAFAAPTILGLTIGEAARRGILIKSTAVVELLARAQGFFFDKTGTLTRGIPELAEVEYAERGYSSELTTPLSLLTHVNPSHPISAALRRALHLPEPPECDGRLVPGRGVVASVDGVDWLLGSLQFMLERGCAVPASLKAAFEERTAQGFSCQFLAQQRTIKGLFVFSDTPRPAAKECLAQLGVSRCHLHLLSGDAQPTAAAIGALVGIQAENSRGALLPEEKGQIVQDSPRPAVFVGDGVNDIAALSAADVGIAFMGGLEPTLESADVVITEPSLHTLVELIRASRRAMRLIHISLALSLLYNITAGTAAMLGYIDPLIAAFLMPTSSFVLVVSMLLFKPFTKHVSTP